MLVWQTLDQTLASGPAHAILRPQHVTISSCQCAMAESHFSEQHLRHTGLIYLKFEWTLTHAKMSYRFLTAHRYAELKGLHADVGLSS